MEGLRCAYLLSPQEFERLQRKLAAWWAVGASTLSPAEVVALAARRQVAR